MGWSGSEKSKLIHAPSHGMRLKSCPISTPPPLQGEKNPHVAKQEEVGEAERDKIAIPTCKRLRAIIKCWANIFH